MKPLLFSLLISAGSLAFTSPSRAQPEASAADNTVRADYRKAQAEMDKGNWQSARLLLIDLLKRSPTFDVAASLGEAEAKLGESAKAAQHLAFALKNVPPKEKAETSTRIRAGLNSVVGNVATIRVSLNRREAQFFVDGEEVGSYPALTEIYLSPGKHTVQARGAGESETREVEAVAGTSKTMAFVLVAETLPTSGLGAPAPKAPDTSSAPEPAGGANGTAIANTDADGPNWTPTLVTGGIALVAFAVGTGFAVDASSAKSDTDQKLKEAQASFGVSNPCAPDRGAGSGVCSELADLKSRREHSRTAATVSFVLGGVFAAATVGTYFFWANKPADAKSTARLGAGFGDGGARLLFQGSF